MKNILLIVITFFFVQCHIEQEIPFFDLLNIEPYHYNLQVDFSESPIDPLTNMKIHPSSGSGESGGRYGCSRIWGPSSLRKGKPKPHRGLDLKADVGTKFKSIYSGIAIVSEKKGKDFGYWVTIKSPNNGVAIKYIHLNKILVKDGDKVKQGQIIGETGDTGAAKNNPHLHIEVSPTMKFNDKCRLNREDPESHIATSFGKNPNDDLKYCNCHKCPTDDCK